MAQRVVKFPKTFALDITIFLDNEKNMGEWSVEKAVQMSVFFTRFF